MTEENQYFLKTMNNVSDKNKILKYIDSNDEVLDFGCSNGYFASFINPNKYFGYDINNLYLKYAKEKNPKHCFGNKIGEKRFNKIICSSVMHEIYSYNGFCHDKVIEVLSSLRNNLKTNGSIILRDGILPEDYNDKDFIELKKPEEAKKVYDIIIDNKCNIEIFFIDNKAYGKNRDLIRFLNIYTWDDIRSIPRESQEEVNFASFKEYENIFKKSGFLIEKRELLTQLEYFKLLSNKIKVEKTWVTKALFQIKPY